MTGPEDVMNDQELGHAFAEPAPPFEPIEGREAKAFEPIEKPKDRAMRAAYCPVGKVKYVLREPEIQFGTARHGTVTVSVGEAQDILGELAMTLGYDLSLRDPR